MTRKEICDFINRELTVATGCTEPAAVALTAATAREYMCAPIEKIEIHASSNMIKNVMAVHIPGIKSAGIEYAAALGVAGGQAVRGLCVIDCVTEEEVESAKRIVQEGRVETHCEKVCDRLFVSVTLHGAGGCTSRVELAEMHTNIVYIEQNGCCVFRKEAQEQQRAAQGLNLTIAQVYRFADELDRSRDNLTMIEKAIAINTRMMEEGKLNSYGLNVGGFLRKAREKGFCERSIVTAVVEDTASGVDARMAGANLPVVTNSGSGNQGITTTVPVLSAGAWLGCSEDKIFRAVTLSNLMALYIHSGFGRLSGLCGATIAATGAACGLMYLLGGNERQIGYVVNNMLGNISGMLCDGAKPDCALKISTCLQAAFQCVFLAMENVGISAAEGIVESSPEKTIRNFNRLGNEGSVEMDNIILDILINKQCGEEAEEPEIV